MSTPTPPTTTVTRSSNKNNASEWKWKVYDPALVVLRAGEKVFFRPKCARPGWQSRLVAQEAESTDRWSVAGSQKSLCQRRLVPVYNDKTIVVTSSTPHFRHLAAAQPVDDDVVLEVGCSTGQASIILVRYCKEWLGVDTSVSMVERTQKAVAATATHSCTTSCVTHVERADPWKDPVGALNIVRRHQGDRTSIIYIDIGGNRSAGPLAGIVEWALNHFPALRLIAIKNESFYETLINTKRKKKNATTTNGALAIDDDDDVIPDGQECLRDALSTACLTSVNSLPTHPLQCHRVMAPHTTTPICRYHNYHKSGCWKADDCPFDHVHCHYCLVSGHVARECPRVHSPA